jgi:hypothetical protein
MAFNFEISEQFTYEMMDKLIGKFAFKIQGEVKRRTPVKTSLARNSVVVEHTAFLVWKVGTNLFYWEFIEKGTEPHDIVPVIKKALYWKGARSPYKKVRHPGTDAMLIFHGVVNDKGLMARLLREATQETLANKYK